MSAKTRAVLKEALWQKGPCDKIKAGSRRQSLYKDTTQDNSDPLGDTIELMKHSENDKILNYICAEFGGVFVKNAEAKASEKTVHQDIAMIFKESADILSVLSDSSKDGKITQEEGEKIRREVDEFNQVVFGLLQEVEKGRRQ